MQNLMKRPALFAFLVVALVVSGCILSGTVTVTKMFYNYTLNSESSAYYKLIDVTEEEEWKDHQDDIQDIDNVGFEFWLTNNAGGANEITCYVDDFGSTLGAASTRAQIVAGATPVVVLPVSNTPSFFKGYADVATNIINLETLKTLGETGQFKFWALSDATPVDFTVDSVKVVITLTAGK